MSDRPSKRPASPASDDDDDRKSSRSDRKKAKKRSHSSDSSGSDSDSRSTRKSKKNSKKQKRKKAKREESSDESSGSSSGSESEDEKKKTKKKAPKSDATPDAKPTAASAAKPETPEEKKKRMIKEAEEAFEADMQEEKQQQVVPFDPKAAAMHKLMTEFGTASKEDQMKMLMAIVANPDLKASAAAVGPPQFPVQGKSNHMKQWFQLAEEKWALMKKGEEVTVTCPEMQAMLYDRKMRNNIHWTNFLDVEKTVAIWLKSGGGYATFQTTYDKMQSFGGKKFEWPNTFVMQGPLMRCEFPRLGIEGNYDRLGQKNGPETIYALDYQVSFTNEIYSQEICDDDRRAYIVSEFFDMLERLQSFCNRKIGMKGGFKDLENAITAKCDAANAKIDEENEKHGTKTPHETLPQTKADWITFIERHCMNNITSTDTNKNVRKTSFNLKVFKKLRKQRSDPKIAHKDDKIIGKDAHYVPIDSPNKIFIKLFGQTDPENGKDWQRKRSIYNMLLPHRPDQVKLKKGEPMPSNPFPYTPVDFTTMEVTQGDVLRPTFSVEFYPNIAIKTGMPKRLIDLEWHGRVGQLNDNPPTACNPLLAVPMATAYTPPPKRGDDDEDDEPVPGLEASSAAAAAAEPAAAAAAAAESDSSKEHKKKDKKEHKKKAKNAETE